MNVTFRIIFIIMIFMVSDNLFEIVESLMNKKDGCIFDLYKICSRILKRYKVCQLIILYLLGWHTDLTKINRPGYNIRIYWTNFRQPTAHVQQNIFGKTLTEVCSPHLYASFGTFYAKIDLSLEAQWVFEVCLKIDN